MEHQTNTQPTTAGDALAWDALYAFFLARKTQGGAYAPVCARIDAADARTNEEVAASVAMIEEKHGDRLDAMRGQDLAGRAAGAA